MTLRARLVLAFLAMSVLPLTAVTLYSYVSTRDAFRRAAEAESGRLARDLGQRMEAVTAEVGHTLDRLWRSPASAAPFAAGGPEPDQPGPLTDTLSADMGGLAGMLDRLEVVRDAPPPPRLPAPTSGLPTVPSPPQLPHTVVLELSKMAPAEAERLMAEARASMLEATEQLREQGASRRRQSMRLRVVGGEIRRARLAGRNMEFTVLRNGRAVGTVHAQLNLNHLLESVPSLMVRERGEIPFAIGIDNQIHTPRPEDLARLKALGVPSLTPTDGRGRLASGEWVVVTRRDPSGVILGIARPIRDSLAEIRRTSIRNLAIGLSFVALALIGIVPLSSRMTRNLSALTEGVQRIAHGDLQARVPVRSRDEIGRLAQSFNRMAQDLETHEHLIVEQERLRQELELSRRIQTEMLPRESLHVGLAEVKGVSIPAREVGGDFYNYFVLPGGHLALLVGDVSGKGIGAALLMANIQATLKARLPLEQNLAALAEALDRDVHANTPPEVYVTLFVGIVDPAGTTLRYVNAGHNPQFVLRERGGLERLPATGVPVGLLPGRGYEERTVSLAEGDLLFFYTDGAVDVENEAGDMFDHEQLEAILLQAAEDADLDAVLARVERAIQTFRGSVEPLDDATMMALRLGTAQP